MISIFTFDSDEGESSVQAIEATVPLHPSRCENVVASCVQMDT